MVQVGVLVVPRRYHDWSKEVKLKRPNLTTPKGEYINHHLQFAI
jgi:hypothetical protein